MPNEKQAEYEPGSNAVIVRDDSGEVVAYAEIPNGFYSSMGEEVADACVSYTDGAINRVQVPDGAYETLNALLLTNIIATFAVFGAVCMIPFIGRLKAK